MKFRVAMKTPDTLHDATQEAAQEWARSVTEIDEEEREALAETRAEELREAASTWFRYGEYLTVEIDTDAGTCVVVADA